MPSLIGQLYSLSVGYEYLIKNRPIWQHRLGPLATYPPRPLVMADFRRRITEIRDRVNANFERILNERNDTETVPSVMER